MQRHHAGALGHVLVGVVVRLDDVAVLLPQLLAHQRDLRRAAHQQDAVVPAQGDARALQRRVADLDRQVDVALDAILELLARDVDGGVEVHVKVAQVQLHRLRLRQLNLHLLRVRSQSCHLARPPSANVAVRLERLFDEIHNDLVKVTASQEGVATIADNAVVMQFRLDESHIERAAAQIKHQKVPLIHAWNGVDRDGSSVGLVHNAVNIQSRFFRCTESRIRLAVLEEGGDGNHGALNLVLQMILGALHEIFQKIGIHVFGSCETGLIVVLNLIHQRSIIWNAFKAVVLVLDNGLALFIWKTQKALHVVNRVRWVAADRFLRHLTEHGALRSVLDHRRRSIPAIARNQCKHPITESIHARKARAKINANYRILHYKLCE